MARYVHETVDSVLLSIFVGIACLAILFGLLYGLVHLVKWMWAH
jgi:hypothetical protein